ncbi:MAG: TetR/AcrR family transcriptional regulator [Clostridia bacterium]|nr:TetR/AcrR family transcriptional regulator [Clostridia bacterium]
MSAKEDLRVKRTKKALAEAFVTVLNEKPFDEITVNELCLKADVRRATFYKHYSDKFDFLASYTRALRDEFDTLIWESEKPEPTKEYYVEYAKQVVEFICEHTKAIKNIYTSNLFPSVLTVIIEQNYKDTCERLERSVAAGMKLNASVEVTAAMCSGGVSAVIFAWLSTGMVLTADELSEQVGNIVAAAIEAK